MNHSALHQKQYFRGHKGDHAQQGSVVVRTRDDASGTRSGVEAGGGAVALMVELLSVYPTMPVSAPLSSYRCGNEVKSVEILGGPRGTPPGGSEGRR